MTTPDPGNCGMKPSQRIVGGEDASEESWPWQVSIQAVLGDGTSQHICGGSIFNYEYVISAAHCVKNYEPSQLIIVAGEYSLSKERGNEQRSSASQIFVRDDFNGHDYVNDIALVHLETPLMIDEVTTNRICLPAQGADYSNQEATILGWGYTEEDGGSFSDILQEAVVQTMTDAECRNSNYNENFIYDHHICAAASGVDSCAGDAGGPLMVIRHNCISLLIHSDID
jgi:secreted trypsin-like serine protease